MIDITGPEYDSEREYAKYRRELLDKHRKTKFKELRVKFDPKNPNSDAVYLGFLGSAIYCKLRGTTKTDLMVDRIEKYDSLNSDGVKLSDKTITVFDYGMPADDLHDEYLNNLLYCNGEMFAILFENMPSEKLQDCPTYTVYGRPYIRQDNLPQECKIK